MDPVTIPTDPAEHPILDHAALVSEGLREIQRLIGDSGQWTDFNAHDPGVTLLEAACYALTDLGYRIFHPIADLLAEGGRYPDAALYTAAQALTGHAVTRVDLCRVALDVEGVRNAWIEPIEHPAAQPASPRPASTTEANPTGLWRALIVPEGPDPKKLVELRRAVAERLHDNRNLCEDFEEIKVLVPLPIQVIASVEIEETANSEEVLLGILARLDAYISPSIRFLTLAEARASAGATIETMFDGPRLQHGFIDRASFSALRRRRELYTSDVIREIMAVPGVRVARAVKIGYEVPVSDVLERDKNDWVLPFGDLHAPRLDLYLAKTQITLLKGGLAALAKERHDALIKGYKPPASSGSPNQGLDLPPPPGRNRDVASYLPLQHELPIAYGLGAGALPESAGDLRHAQVGQLRAYLTMFDQLLANEFAQLAHLPELFSARDEAALAYASKLVPGSAEEGILINGFDRASLQKIVDETSGPGAARRPERFLDHLLARFGETIGDDMLDAKRQFLKDLPRLSSARGTGVNYLAKDGTETEPALAERVRLKLGLKKGELLVVEHILLRPITGDLTDKPPFLAGAKSVDPLALQLSFVLSAENQTEAQKKLFEKVAREETPAHLVAHVVWAPDLAAFRQAYEAWLTALRDYWVTDPARLGPALPG